MERLKNYQKYFSYDVARYAKNLAVELGLDTKSANEIYLCGLLHDLGKSTIPNQILNKNGKLNLKEWAIVVTHPLNGFKILNEADNDKFKTQALSAYSHHEKWNGKGYPRGLAKDNIPISARIVSIADVYDALIEKRAYKEAWDKDRVLEYMKKQKEINFDPDILDIFLDNIEGCELN